MGRFAVGVVVALMLCGAGEAPVFDSGGSGEASRLLVHANEAAVHGRYSEALAADTRALALMPSYGDAFSNRGYHFTDEGRYDEALADFDRAFAMHPDAMPLGMARVAIALRRGDGATAMAALKAAMQLPLHDYWRNSGHFFVTGHMESYAYMYSSIAEQLMHHDDASLADMQRMLALEVEHPEHILADYCYLAGVAGLLESAELACQQSIEDNAHDIGQYDSLGYVHLRMKQWDKAIADYDHAIGDRPDLTLSLYGRGVARRAKGDIAGGNADIAAATRNEPDIAQIMKRLGVTST